MKIIKNNDIAILLFLLLVFSLGIGWIYSQSTENTKIETVKEKIKEAKPEKEKKEEEAKPEKEKKEEEAKPEKKKKEEEAKPEEEKKEEEAKPEEEKKEEETKPEKEKKEEETKPEKEKKEEEAKPEKEKKEEEAKPEKEKKEEEAKPEKEKKEEEAKPEKEKKEEEAKPEKEKKEEEAKPEKEKKEEEAKPEKEKKEEEAKPEKEKKEEEAKPEKEKKEETKKETVPKTTVPEPKKLPEPPKEITFKKSDIPKKAIDLTTEGMLEYLDEWGKARALTSITDFLKEKCPKDKVANILKTVIEKYNFAREQKLKLILVLEQHYKKDKKIQKQIFDLIAQDKDIEEGEIPLLFLAVEIGERETIPDIVEWYKGQKRPKVRDLAKQTLEYAAKHDYDEALKKLHEKGAKIDKDYATKLLWILIKSNAGFKSIEFLKKRGADLNSHDPKSKYTILIQAIKNKNIKVVKKLIDIIEKDTEQAIKKFVNAPSKDKKIGYPLQNARELKLIKLEAFLREKGAKD